MDKNVVKSLKWVDSIYDHYRIGKKLGKGAYGQVNVAVSKNYGFKCAVKSIKKDQSQHNAKRFYELV